MLKLGGGASYSYITHLADCKCTLVLLVPTRRAVRARWNPLRSAQKSQT